VKGEIGVIFVLSKDKNVIQLTSENPMNYLAHLHLAKLTNTSFTGNLVADFCHVNQMKQLPLDIQNGIAMHQFVDKTLDSHVLSLHFRAEQQIGRRRFAGIVQDLLMDYWLVNKWSQYSDVSLDLFYQEFLPDLMRHKGLVNEAYQRLIESLDQQRWLANLGELKGIQRALMSIVKTWRYGDYLMPFYHSLPQLIDSSEGLFDAVYPDVINAVKEKALLI